jgi:glycolate oxidase
MTNVAQLRTIVGRDYVITRREQMASYLVDETAAAIRPRPAESVVLVKPANAEEVAGILQMANHDHTPVFVRGGGTGICGGAVPTVDGIVVTTERLNRIEENRGS